VGCESSLKVSDAGFFGPALGRPANAQDIGRQKQMDPTYFILILAPMVLAVLAWRGCLGRGALDAGPSREVGLVPADLLITLGLMVVGGSLGGMMLKAGYLGSTGDEADSLTTIVQAKRVLMGQATGQLPAVLYFLWRASGGGAGIFWTNPGNRGLTRIGETESGGVGGLWRVGVLPRKPLRDLLLGVRALFVAIPLVMGTILVAQVVGSLFGYQAPTIAHDLLNMLLESDSTTATALIIFSATVVAPVLEEAIFRGVFQSVLVEWFGKPMRWSVVLVGATVFALIHVGAVPVQALFGLFVFGVVLGWLYERTGSLWPSIIVHIGFNSFNVIVAMNTTVQGG
jgi:membrane protease YdiL (CAAX protease family)